MFLADFWGLAHARARYILEDIWNFLMVSVIVLLVLSAVLGPTTALDEPSAVRKFSLVTKNGENVLHKDFDRQRLTDGLDHLSLAFRAANHDVSQASIFAMLGFLWWALQIFKPAVRSLPRWFTLSFFIPANDDNVFFNSLISNWNEVLIQYLHLGQRSKLHAAYVTHKIDTIAVQHFFVPRIATIAYSNEHPKSNAQEIVCPNSDVILFLYISFNYYYYFNQRARTTRRSRIWIFCLSRVPKTMRRLLLSTVPLWTGFCSRMGGHGMSSRPMVYWR